jgi:hypothetical protein
LLRMSFRESDLAIPRPALPFSSNKRS